MKRYSLPAATRCLVAGFFVLCSSAVYAQVGSDVVRPWKCLSAPAASVASGFGAHITMPGCTVPAVTWAGPQPATAIAPPGLPTGLAATVTGNTVALTWTPPKLGGAPT